MVADTLKLRDILQAKGVPCRRDLRGHDVNHDWQWWRKQSPDFLEKLHGNRRPFSWLVLLPGPDR